MPLGKAASALGSLYYHAGYPCISRTSCWFLFPVKDNLAAIIDDAKVA